MQLFSKLQQGYENLWKLIIRPTRNTYPTSELGPQVFFLEGKQVHRVDFELENDRGLLFYCSHFIPIEKPSYPCVIYLHGNSSNRTEGVQYLSHLIKQGISLVTFDFTGCGNSQGQYISLGWYEWKDLAEVVKHLKSKNNVTDIALWGRSMGAVTTLMYLKRDPTIKAAVFDSPFKSLKALIQDLCRKNSKIPMFILAGAMKIIAMTIQQKAKFDIYKLNPIKYEVPEIRTPGFFVLAKDDELIDPNHSRELYSVYPQQKYLREVAGTHNSTRPDSCIKEIIKFLRKHLNTEEMSEIKQVEKVEKVATEKQKFDFFEEDFKMGTQVRHQVDFFNVEEESKANQFSIGQLISNLNPFNIGQIEDPYEQLKKQIKETYVPQQTRMKAKLQARNLQKQTKRKKDQEAESKVDCIYNWKQWCF